MLAEAMETTHLFNTLRLAARIHGLITAALPQLRQELIDLMSEASPRFRRPKVATVEAVRHELPVLLLILALQEMDAAEPNPADEEMEFLKACLVHFFAAHYASLYLEHKDPLKETLARVDWYLDGAGGPPDELFSRFVSTLFPNHGEEMDKPIHRFIDQKILPRVRKALDLAPKYRD